MTSDSGMTLTGANETALYLKNFHREIYDVLAGEVKAILKRTQAGAKSRFGDGAWTISFGTAGKWPAGQISTAPGSAGRGRWSDAPPGAKAAIFDMFGRRTPVESMATPQARGLGRKLNAEFGRPQRFLWPSWLDNREESMKQVEQAFARAEARLQAKMDGA